MQEFVRGVRHDLRNPSLPIVAVQISRVISWEGGRAAWNSIQDQQRRQGEVIRSLSVVPAIDLELVDFIHIAGYDQNRLGRRLAEAMQFLRGESKKGKPPIAIRKISVRQLPTSTMGDVVIEFDNVIGKLQSLGRPAGFSLSTAKGPASGIIRITLDGDRAILQTGVPLCDLASCQVSYGAGLDPYCNITDSADRSLPVFGPLATTGPRALTPMVRTVSVSPFQPSAGKLHDLSYPQDLSALGLTPRTFTTYPAHFCNLHDDIVAATVSDPLIYLACRVNCSEPMKLAALLGYDGPVKMWIDGKQVFHDPDGTNPAVIDRRRIAMDAAAGDHAVLVALGSNNRAAWGIFLRFERLDVPKNALKLGPGNYVLPAVSPL